MKRDHIKIVFPTNDLATVNAKFDNSTYLAVYDVSVDTSEFIHAAQFDPETSADEQLQERCNISDGSSLLFTFGQLGGLAAFHMVNNKIFAIKIGAPESIEALIAKTQDMMSGNPPLWLKRALNKDQADQESKEVSL